MRRREAKPPPEPSAVLDRCKAIACAKDRVHGTSWCRPHAMKAWELRCDLRPHIDWLLDDLPDAQAEPIRRGLRGQGWTSGDKLPKWKAQLHNLCGEAAARMRLGANNIAGMQISTSMGRKGECRVFRKMPTSELIFCISPWNDPLSASVLAWIEPGDFRRHARAWDHGYAMNWQPIDPWRRVEELL